MREKAAEAAALKKKSSGAKRKVKKEKEDVNELPEVDQNTKKGLVHRAKASPKVK